MINENFSNEALSDLELDQVAGGNWWDVIVKIFYHPTPVIPVGAGNVIPVGAGNVIPVGAGNLRR